MGGASGVRISASDWSGSGEGGGMGVWLAHGAPAGPDPDLSKRLMKGLGLCLIGESSASDFFKIEVVAKQPCDWVNVEFSSCQVGNWWSAKISLKNYVGQASLCLCIP